PAALWVGAPADRAGRASVRPDLSVDGAPNVFVIGDTAHAVDAKGKAVPGLAPAAKQQGEYVGRLLKARLKGKPFSEPFHYADYGILATVGRKAAVAEFGGVKLTGFFAWLFWCVIHIYFLIGFRNRIVITLDWIWSYFTLERGARLITGDVAETPLKPKVPMPRAATAPLRDPVCA
ncbi:MAG: NAD(P)/FAD-dependent oxidoreductase, partial [Parvularculaceae bacterium]